MCWSLSKRAGLKDYLFSYGVGDHGGGPTRRDLNLALRMDSWPIFPHVKFSTTDDFFAIAEAQAKDLPVVDAEMNSVFEGCYTSESNIKFANRKSENALVEAEMAALLGKGLAGLPYPTANLLTGWRHALLNQFHDILPGSGVRATYDYAQGLFQEIMAQTTMIKTQALRAIAGMVDTATACPLCEGFIPGKDDDLAFGGGQGDVASDGMVTRYGTGLNACCDPFVVFNPNPWARSEVIITRLWNRTYADEHIAVKDDAGQTFPAQVLKRGSAWGGDPTSFDAWGHDFIEVAFPAHAVPAGGYRSYSVVRSVAPGTAAVAALPTKTV